jgi:hypothetical protein
MFHFSQHKRSQRRSKLGPDNQHHARIQVTGFGFAETNTTHRGRYYEKWHSITKKIFKTSPTITSESDIIYDQHYKPGGTLTTVVGKWQSRVSERGTDNSGLGRWSFIRLSSNKKSIVIVTAYKPLKTQGPYTAWTLQWTLL